MVAGFAALLITAMLAAHLLGPPIEISATQHGVEVDLRSLGEYNSSLYSIQIADLESNRVIWRVEARERELQVYLLSLSVGDNSRDLGLLEQDESLHLILPEGDSLVNFRRGGRYEIVASTKRWFGLELTTTRTFEM